MQTDQRRVGALALTVMLTVACSVRPERSILDQFFAAARLRDNTALRKLATTTFEPLERGIIVDFKIADVETIGAERKKVTIVAPVEVGDHQVVEKRLVVTLERGVLKDDPETARRWVVTAIEETP
jgi:hypothetical protein